jgi:hypothetical protein
MMQAIGEGFEILKASPFNLDLRRIADLWNQGSVVRSWLMELAERAFAQEGNDLKTSAATSRIQERVAGPFNRQLTPTFRSDHHALAPHAPRLASRMNRSVPRSCLRCAINSAGTRSSTTRAGTE